MKHNNTDLREENLTEKDKAFLKELLESHEENLRKLLKQKSIYGTGEEPLSLLRKIEAEEQEIKEIKSKLIR